MTYHVVNDVSDLSDALKNTRKVMGVNQKEMAELHALSRHTVINAESGQGDPRLSTMLTMLHALGLRMVIVSAGAAERGVLNFGDER